MSFYKLNNDNIVVESVLTSGIGVIETELILDLSKKWQFNHSYNEFFELKWRVRIDIDGNQISSAYTLAGFDDVKNEYIDAPIGFNPNSGDENSRCISELGFLRLFTPEEYAVFISRPTPTSKELIIKDYENRTILGNNVYKDLQAEIVQYFADGVGLEIIVPLEAKFNPVLYGLKTGDFITSKMNLPGVITNNQTELDFKNYAILKVDEVVNEQGWLQA